jgi:Tripartite tricarboxylate transporter family receptor
VVPLKETELALTSSMRAVIPVKPVTTPASKLTINPILVMACGFACSSAFIVPSHDSVRTSALTGKQIKVKATNSIRGMDAAQWGRGLQPTKSLRRLLDHLVGAGEQRRWDFEPERLGRLEIDRQFILDRRLHRQVGRLLALEDAIHVACRVPKLVDESRPIGDQAAANDEVACEVNRGQFVSGRQRDDQIAMNRRQSASRYDQAAIRGTREGRDSALDLASVTHIDRGHLGPDRWRYEIRDIAPVAAISREPHIMVVNPSVPAKTVPEFIAYAKGNPGKISMASGGMERRPIYPANCLR